MPNCRAELRLEALRPTPTTVATAAAALSASAKDPPIRPTPTTTTFPSAGAGTASAFASSGAVNGLPQRGKKAPVFLLETDRDAKMLRQTVVRHRPHDHAFAQQPVVDRGGIADADQDEVAVRRHVADAERVEAAHQLFETGKVQARAFFHVRRIAERCKGGGLRHRIDVEWLPHAVQHVGDRDVHQTIADTQSGQTV